VISIDNVDPTEIGDLRDALASADPDRRLRPISMDLIDIRSGALAGLRSAVRRLIGQNSVLMVVDATHMSVRGNDLKAKVESDLRSEFSVEVFRITPLNGEVRADERTVEAAQEAAAHSTCVVAVGSGTVTDISKEVAKARGIPLVIVQTAASVNAFSDDMAVLLREGAKRTVPSVWPNALLIDLDVLASAPYQMNLAGFGDLMAAWTAPADWRLSQDVGMDDSFHDAPIRLLRRQAIDLLSRGREVALVTEAGLASLARVLTLSGISLGVAGSTAPLSGMEHLLSHLLDMRAEQEGRPLALHGAQVGLTSVIAASIWSRFIADFDPALVEIQACYPDYAEFEACTLSTFADLDPAGALGSECWRDCEDKLRRWISSKNTFTAFLRDWSGHRETLRDLVRDPGEILQSLRAAQAPSQFASLSPAVSVDDVTWALGSMPFMRKRFTLVDLLHFTGRWGKDATDQVIEDAYSLGLFDD
jgi:glycerol-1-phosphate dehydrogenase [NAD(P)+]